MIIRSLCITIAMAALACKTCPAIPFDDNFDDGDLAGWEIKQGDWYNAGHSLMSSYDNYGIIWVADSFGLDQRIDVDAYFDGSASSKTAQLRVRSGDAGSGGNRFFDHGYFAAVVPTSTTRFSPAGRTCSARSHCRGCRMVGTASRFPSKAWAMTPICRSGSMAT